MIKNWSPNTSPAAKNCLPGNSTEQINCSPPFVSISYDMADVLAEDIGDDFNMQVMTCDREHRGMDGFIILLGEYCEEYISLERTVFESYVGEYW